MNLRHARTGRLIAATLAGAWRRSGYPDLKIAPDDLQAITPHLQRSGAAALACWRIRDTELAASPSAAVLRREYRSQALRCAACEIRIEYLFRLLDEASIEAILLKGWASASFYPDVTLHPYADIEIFVRPGDLARAQALLREALPSEIDCDLHDRVTDLPDRPFEALLQRSRLATIKDRAICILGVEDHLALLCLHFVRHDAGQPVWLCDIGATLEALPEGFDWATCTGANPIEARWIASVIDLARLLLGAEARSLPQAHRRPQPPAWLVKWTLSHWTDPEANRPPALTPLSRFVTRPRGLWRDIRARWPKPTTVAIHFRTAPEAFPLPYQVLLFVSRSARFFSRFATGRARR